MCFMRGHLKAGQPECASPAIAPFSCTVLRRAGAARNARRGPSCYCQCFAGSNHRVDSATHCCEPHPPRASFPSPHRSISLPIARRSDIDRPPAIAERGS